MNAIEEAREIINGVIKQEIIEKSKIYLHNNKKVHITKSKKENDNLNISINYALFISIVLCMSMIIIYFKI